MIRLRERPLPVIFLFLCFAASLGAQSSGPAEEANRKTLEGILRERGIPFLTRGNSLLIPGGGSGLILAAPLAYPGEAPLEAGGAGGPGEAAEGGRGAAGALPFRFSAPLSLFRGREAPGKEGPPAGGGEPLPALVFLGGGGYWAELGEILGAAEISAAEDGAPSGESPALSPDPAPADRRAVVFLDIPRGENGGSLAFGLAGAPPLGHLLSALQICEALELPWAFEGPFLASGSPAEKGGPGSPEGGGTPPGAILIRLEEGREGPEGGAAAMEENLGEFLRRYAGSRGPEEERPERNYLLLRFRGKLFVIGERPLILGFLGLGLLCFCGFLFLPPADPEGPPRRGRRLPAAAILWLCLAALAAAAFRRLSLYPLLAPALLPAFAGRSIRGALPRRICLAAALLYLGIIFLRGL